MKERGNSFLRFCDRFFGIPLILFLSLFKKKGKEIPKSITSILLFKFAGIGDLALISGVILDLRKKFPKAEIVLFTGKENGEMGKLIQGIEVIPLQITSPFKA